MMNREREYENINYHSLIAICLGVITTWHYFDGWAAVAYLAIDFNISAYLWSILFRFGKTASRESNYE